MNWKNKSRLFTAEIVFLSAFILLGSSVLNAQGQGQRGNLYQLLRDDIGFSKNEFTEMKEGKVVTKRLETKVKQEIAVFSIVRINAQKEFFIQNYGKDGMNIETVTAEETGKFSSSPELDDVRSFSMPSTDLKELAKCQICKCKVKAPADLIEEFRQLDKSAPDFEAQANRLFRQVVVEYVQEYLKEGDAALVVYNDKENPIRLSEEFQDLLKGSLYMYKYVPELRTYLKEFPNGELHNVKNVFYWKKENFDGKAKQPIISINHAVFYQRPDADKGVIIASKQLYASHYFEAALGLTVIVDDPESADPGFYLMHINRSRIDILREIPEFLTRDFFKGAHNLIDKRMMTVKKNVEDAYKAM